jgi:hypothetical protein
MPTRLPVFWEDGIDLAQEPEEASSRIGVDDSACGLHTGFGARR